MRMGLSVARLRCRPPPASPGAKHDICCDMIDLPPEITGSSVWYGPALARSAEWLETLSAAEVQELEAAIAPLAARNVAFNDLGRSDFPLPTLARRLLRLRRDILDGRGFVLVRGMPVERWSMRESALAFYGVGTHLGNARPQNAAGEVLGHVKDLGLRSDDPNVRIYQTSERQTFHTDSCDVVGLLCLQTAKLGGDSLLVSSNTLWNETRRRRPDLAALLLQPLATDKRGEEAEGDQPFFSIPVFNWHAGLMSTIYQRQYIESAQRFASAPRLTPQQRAALDFFDALANDADLNFAMTLQRGDLQLVHNHTLLHDRTAFEDWPEPDRRRYLLRLWLAPTEARRLPSVFAERYGTVVPGFRGGVTQRNTGPRPVAVGHNRSVE